LAAKYGTREFACAAIIDLVTRSAIRAGNETYTRLRGTRGAVTLLKSNVTVRGKVIMLRFRSKGGKTITKEVSAPRLAKAVRALLQLRGRRLFQYQSESGAVRALTAHEVNTCLREMAGTRISLKDFRTLLASARVLETLAPIKPAPRERQRRKQVRAAVSAAADDLANTPTICRKSYVHESVVRAFEQGILQRFSATLKHSQPPIGRAKVLAEIIATMGTTP
jgi:DNA topoisomerase-1